MTSKTIALTGDETRVDYGGGTNVWLRNDGTDAIYASTSPGITAGADGTASIPAGQAMRIDGTCGTVYLLGTGSIQLVGSDYTACPFKVSAQSGGSGADDVARAAIGAHAGNADIHVTAAQKSAWDGKAELSDIPAKLGYVNYLGYVYDVDDILNNPNYSECSYECVITTAEAALMGLPSCWWQIKYLRHTDNNGFGCQIAFPIDGPGNPPRYRTSAGLVWADWKLFQDGGNAATLESHPASDFALQSALNAHTGNKAVHVSDGEKSVWNTTASNLASHSADSAVHVTAGEKGAWNGAASNIAAHAADSTVHVTAAAKASWGGYSNENLFDNPDFAINQRGAAQYSVKEKTGVDRWTLQGSNSTIKITVLPSGGVQVENGGENAGIKQFYPADEITAGETYTISAKIDGVRRAVTIVAATDNSGVATYPGTTIYAAIIYDTAGGKWAVFPYVTYTAGQSVVVKDVKLELGNRATRFDKPNPALELIKCQRYYQIRSTNDIDPVDLRPAMRTTPRDITKVTGGYAYVAEY